MKFSEYMMTCSRAQIVVLGPGRAGKTSLAYSVTQAGKTLGIESEEGVHAAAAYIKAENLELEMLTRRKKTTTGWTTVPLREQPPVKKRLEEITEMAYSGGYKFVVVDSLTDIAGRFEDEYARKVGQVSQGDWYKIIEGMKTFVRDMKNGNFHLICTCIAAPPKEGSLIEISPSLPGQLREQMLPMFQSIVLLKYDKKEQKRLLTVNDPARGVCDRFHSFGRDVHEVDVTDDPAKAMRIMVSAAEKYRPEAEKAESVVKKAASSGVVRRTAVR